MVQFEVRPALWQPEINEFFGHRDHLLPACEIVDSASSLTLSLDVPGFRKEDIELEIKDRKLHVSGIRKAKAYGEKEKLLRQERRFGKFHRTFELPEGIDEQAVSAKFTDGVLEINMPKTEVVTRKIAVI